MEKKNRALFIDMLKGLALLLMIEVHVFNSFLDAGIKEAAWFPFLNFINGLVAPAFTFTSGMVFILSLQKGVDELRKFGAKFWKKLGRLLLILIAGYSIHMPFMSLRKIMNPDYPHMIKELLRVDVLQCIAVGLMILLFLRILIKSDKVYYSVILALNLLILFLSPLTWQTDLSKQIPLGIANYFNRIHGSLFPLFPWGAFIFTGALAGKLYVELPKKVGEKKLINYFLICGLIFFFGSVLILNVIAPEWLVSIKPNFFFFIERLGVLLALLAALWYFLEEKQNYKSFILDVSRESLMVYWLHLKFIYKKFWNDKNLIDLLGTELNVLEALAVTILLATVMVLLAKIWGWLKYKYPLVIQRGTGAVVTVCVVIFFFF